MVEKAAAEQYQERDVDRPMYLHTRLDGWRILARDSAAGHRVRVSVAAEALTNGQRHRPGAAVSIDVMSTDDALRVEITDDGPGFDPDMVPAHRCGIREAIVGRMRSVGGDTAVTSGPAGASVTLRWAP
ncbi:ATP-binding protein [Micromonospora echinofusca]|uniref:Histidine kinase/HSP90-like ATPase domain-containing protein n=1 Tax=Micromonospora echinofusca TaxID=47858 RepID=A0ABS3VR68_MICEH|nr:ATP-binding protein [Micromonospora echinofusca]MBO4206883.1 hypothetical protein [Micromonospora echinofusca]